MLRTSRADFPYSSKIKRWTSPCLVTAHRLIFIWFTLIDVVYNSDSPQSAVMNKTLVSNSIVDFHWEGYTKKLSLRMDIKNIWTFCHKLICFLFYPKQHSFFFSLKIYNASCNFETNKTKRLVLFIGAGRYLLEMINCCSHESSLLCYFIFIKIK